MTRNDRTAAASTHRDAACAEGLMCPLGQGTIDYVEIRTLLERLHYSGQIIVEHERSPQNAHLTLPISDSASTT
jgi:sugar phosphate isomerase/epimerase